MRLKDNSNACVEPDYRGERTCRECYFSQVNEKNQWTGSQRCWNAGCIEADTSEMPTDILRALLDERGIEWKECEPLGANAITRFCVNGVWLRYVDYGDYCWIDYHEDAPLTPEQAIAATVGGGTCKLVDNDSGPDMHCTACGGGVDDEYRYFMDSWGYSRCPHCGAQIIEED